MIILIVCCVLAVACSGVLIWIRMEQNRVEKALNNARKDPESIASETVQTYPPKTDTPEVNPSIEQPDKPTASQDSETADPTMTVPEYPENPAEPAEIPYDFDYLHGINPDIYAWLQLNCTGQEFPVLSNDTDADYYLHHDIYKNYSSLGSLYTQSVYNRIDFQDACTIIYGHNMGTGSMFGALEAYTINRNLDDDTAAGNYFILYTTSKILTYRIACTGVYSTNHVLYYHNFYVEDDFNSFFEELRTYTDTVNFATNFTPTYGDNLVILSTCHQPNDYYRYLVVGVLVNQQGK